jgi:hypothetical protein
MLFCYSIFSIVSIIVGIITGLSFSKNYLFVASILISFISSIYAFSTGMSALKISILVLYTVVVLQIFWVLTVIAVNLFVQSADEEK